MKYPEAIIKQAEELIEKIHSQISYSDFATAKINKSLSIEKAIKAAIVSCKFAMSKLNPEGSKEYMEFEQIKQYLEELL